jgi:hypothetical protein
MIGLLLQSQKVLLLLLFKLLLVNHLCLDLKLQLLLLCYCLQLRLSPIELDSVHVGNIDLKIFVVLVVLNLVNEQVVINHF